MLFSEDLARLTDNVVIVTLHNPFEKISSYMHSPSMLARDEDNSVSTQSANPTRVGLTIYSGYLVRV